MEAKLELSQEERPLAAQDTGRERKGVLAPPPVFGLRDHDRLPDLVTQTFTHVRESPRMRIRVTASKGLVFRKVRILLKGIFHDILLVSTA
jgi:hypothetical protein